MSPYLSISATPFGVQQGKETARKPLDLTWRPNLQRMRGCHTSGSVAGMLLVISAGEGESAVRRWLLTAFTCCAGLDVPGPGGRFPPLTARMARAGNPQGTAAMWSARPAAGAVAGRNLAAGPGPAVLV